MNKDFKKDSLRIDSTYPKHVYERRKKENNKGNMKFFLFCLFTSIIIIILTVIPEYKEISYMNKYGHVYLKNYIKDKVYLNSPDYILFSKSLDEWYFMKEYKNKSSKTETISYVPLNDFKACFKILLSKIKNQ